MKIKILAIIAASAILCVSCGGSPQSRVGQDEPLKGKPLSYAEVYENNEKQIGYIDVDGNWAFLFPDTLEFVSRSEMRGDVFTEFSCGRLPVHSKTTGLFGYLDIKGNLVIPCQFRGISPFLNDYASARTETGNVVIDKNGKIIHRQDAGEECISIVGDKFFLARQKADNSGLETRIVNTKGKELMAYDGHYYGAFTNDPRYSDILFQLADEKHVGVVNMKGEQIIPSENCLRVLACPDGKSLIAILGNHEDPCVYNTDGKKVKVLDFVWIIPQKEGWHDDMLLVDLKGHGKGFINSNFEPVYIDDSLLTSGMEVHSFHDGLARLQDSWKTIYINKQGHQVFRTIVSGGEDFNEGVANVRTYDDWGFIDNKGDSICSSKALKGDEQNVQYFLFPKCVANRIPVRKENYNQPQVSTIGFIDRNGKKVIPFKFHAVGGFHYTESNNVQ